MRHWRHSRSALFNLISWRKIAKSPKITTPQRNATMTAGATPKDCTATWRDWGKNVMTLHHFEQFGAAGKRPSPRLSTTPAFFRLALRGWRVRVFDLYPILGPTRAIG